MNLHKGLTQTLRRTTMPTVRLERQLHIHYNRDRNIFLTNSLIASNFPLKYLDP